LTPPEVLEPPHGGPTLNVSRACLWRGSFSLLRFPCHALGGGFGGLDFPPTWLLPLVYPFLFFFFLNGCMGPTVWVVSPKSPVFFLKSARPPTRVDLCFVLIVVTGDRFSHRCFSFQVCFYFTRPSISSFVWLLGSLLPLVVADPQGIVPPPPVCRANCYFKSGFFFRAPQGLKKMVHPPLTLPAVFFF